MFKYFLSRFLVYAVVLVFIVPLIILFYIGYSSRSKNTEVINEGSKQKEVQGVPLPSKEDVVRAFCSLINEGKISEAVLMMDNEDDTVRQSWGVSLNNFSSFVLIDINPSKVENSVNTFEIDVDVKLKENLTNLPIPNYGWRDGINKRWITLVEKEKGRYKIAEIATGP